MTTYYLDIQIPPSTWQQNTDNLYTGFYSPPSEYNNVNGTTNIYNSYSGSCEFLLVPGYYSWSTDYYQTGATVTLTNQSPTWNTGTWTADNTTYGYSNFDVEVTVTPINQVNGYNSGTLTFKMTNLTFNNDPSVPSTLPSNNKYNFAITTNSSIVTIVTHTGSFSNITASDISLYPYSFSTELPYISDNTVITTKCKNCLTANNNNFTIDYNPESDINLTLSIPFPLVFEISNYTPPASQDYSS